jgi:hypothetical protein
VELELPVAVPVSPVSVVLAALLLVAPNSIWPIHDPARPAAMPVSKGFRCINEGCMAGADWAVGDGPLEADGGVAADGLGVVDCSIGFAPF